jgi:hypothetical protein
MHMIGTRMSWERNGQRHMVACVYDFTIHLESGINYIHRCNGTALVQTSTYTTDIEITESSYLNVLPELLLECCQHAKIL